ncbi:hypothetical protein QC762_305124 [Podospora pseudocomata]|uniref:Uncharacterized protein n=1 Tax=Podospora pseudocomata TaxID=2093779 RepID=A0ABR0GJE6_9PEZI|nr:hypothetical protein QC762_305124 [Podospora pseudocomata]
MSRPPQRIYHRQPQQTPSALTYSTMPQQNQQKTLIKTEVPDQDTPKDFSYSRFVTNEWWSVKSGCRTHNEAHTRAGGFLAGNKEDMHKLTDLVHKFKKVKSAEVPDNFVWCPWFCDDQNIKFAEEARGGCWPRVDGTPVLRRVTSIEMHGLGLPISILLSPEADMVPRDQQQLILPQQVQNPAVATPQSDLTAVSEPLHREHSAVQDTVAQNERKTPPTDGNQQAKPVHSNNINQPVISGPGCSGAGARVGQNLMKEAAFRGAEAAAMLVTTEALPQNTAFGKQLTPVAMGRELAQARCRFLARLIAERILREPEFNEPDHAFQRGSIKTLHYLLYTEAWRTGRVLGLRFVGGPLGNRDAATISQIEHLMHEIHWRVARTFSRTQGA